MDFNAGLSTVKDDHKNGWPATSVTESKISAAEKRVREDCRVTVQEVAEFFCVVQKCTGDSDKLGMTCLCNVGTKASHSRTLRVTGDNLLGNSQTFQARRKELY